MQTDDTAPAAAEINMFTATAGTRVFDPWLLEDTRISGLEINCLV